MNQKVIMEGVQSLIEKLQGWVEGFIEMVPNLLFAIIIVLFFWALSGWVYQSMMKMFKKTQFNESLEGLVANCCKIGVFMLGVIFALAVLQLQKTVFSLLAGVGVIGLALGFAFQDLAANFISGIMLAVRCPLRIGDVIKISDVMGSVIDIRLRDTLVRNFDGQDIIIPNKDFMTNKFTNYSTFGRRKIRIDVGIGYEDDAQKGTEVVLQALKKVPNVLQDPAPEAYVGGLGDSSVSIFGHVWFTYPGGEGGYFQVQHDSIVLIKKELEAAGFNIPFPIRTIDLNEGTKEVLTNLKK